MWRPSSQCRRGGRRVLALLVLGPLLYGCEPGLAPAPRPQPPPAIAWQAMGQTVALQLTQAGVPPAYVPALTQEYLDACQVALLQGATMPQAEAFATYHLAQVLQRLSAQGSGGPGASQRGTAGSSGAKGLTVDQIFKRHEDINRRQGKSINAIGDIK